MNSKDGIPPKSLVNQETIETWKVGHPKFSPYSIGQKVLRKVHKKGNLVIDKLKPIYDGIYEIVKVQPNSVTYEIKKMNDTRGLIIKVHYEQIKKFIELPSYLAE